jgi:glycosyltransferase involved in cell wall biosynthesis
MILSICIPTYNRIKYLKVLLNSLVLQINEANLNDNIEIIISNNNSDDGTLEFLESFKKEHSTIRIETNHNENNIGVVKNIIKLVTLSKAKFWYFIGDDDYIPAGILGLIVEDLNINQNIPVHIFNQLNNQVINQSKEVSITNAAKNFFYYLGNAVTICDTKLTKQIINEEYDEVVKTCWPQTYIYFRVAQISKIVKPFYLSTLTIFNSQAKNNNNLISAHYIFNSIFLNLYLLNNSLNLKQSNLNKIDYLKGIKPLNGLNFLIFIHNLFFLYYYNDLPIERLSFEKDLALLKAENNGFKLKTLLFCRKIPKQYYKIYKIFYLTLFNFSRTLVKEKKLSNPIILWKKTNININQLIEQKLKLMNEKSSHSLVKNNW